MAWAWTPHSGRTHFAHPPPRVMGTQKALTKTWPRTIVDAHKFTRIWASTRTLYCVSMTAHKMRPTPHANWASRRTHTASRLHPHLSTYAHNLTHDMGTQTTAGLTRFRQLWATTNFVGGQALFWASTKLGANAHSWAPKADNHWASTRNRGSPRVIVGSHAILWATTRFPERPRNCVSRPREVMDAHT